MIKKFLLFSFICFSLFFMSSAVFASNTNIKNEFSNSASKIGNTVENVRNSIMEIGNTVTNNSSTSMRNTDNSKIGTNVFSSTDISSQSDDRGYNTARLTTDTTDVTNSTWIWVVIGVIALIIIFLSWYYVSSNNNTNSSHDDRK